jgi:hypothetical protein
MFCTEIITQVLTVGTKLCLEEKHFVQSCVI